VRLSACVPGVDEAHFRADADLRAKWVLRGEPALVDSTSPKLGEKATYYSGICLETGEVESMLVTSTCSAETSTAFLRQLRDRRSEPLIVIWDNSPAHRGPEIRAYLATPELKLQFVALPAYSPDVNPDEAIWDWAREEVTANTCFGAAVKVREKMDTFFVGLAERGQKSSDDAGLYCGPSRCFDGQRKPVARANRPCRSHLGFRLDTRSTFWTFYGVGVLPSSVVFPRSRSLGRQRRT
jgi:transposase